MSRLLSTKAGKPVAALVDIAMFTRLRKLDEEFDRMRVELAQAFEGMTEKAGNALIDEAVKDVRARRSDLLALRDYHPIETPAEFVGRR